MSWTSPFTVAITMRPAVWRAASGSTPPLASRRAVRSASMYGMRWATACFMTRALLTTWGRNMRPAPNRSPTTFMPAISGPSMTSMGRSATRRASSVSATTKSPTPSTSAWRSRSSTVPSRHDMSRSAPPDTFSRMVSATSSIRSVASGRRSSTRSSTRSRRSGSRSSTTGRAPALTMPMSMPAAMALTRNTAWMASRTGSLPRNENETFETPPLTSTPGSSALMRLRGLDVRDRVAVVLLDARADGEDVGVEDDVLGVEAGLLREQAYAPDGRCPAAAPRSRPGLARRRPSRPPRRRIGVPAAPGAGTPPRPP